MKLIFIRHAEPDYTRDSLTEKGFREAEILAKRTKDWKVTQFYCSPLGRAQATARPTLQAHNVTLTTEFPAAPPDTIQMPDSSKAIVYPWLREVKAPLEPEMHPGHKHVPWDFPAEFLKENPILFDKDHWWEAPILQSCNIKKQYDWICSGIDGVLAVHGYERDGVCYRTFGSTRTSDDFMKYDGNTIECLKHAAADEPVLVCFCHLGVMMTMVSHLINTSPYTMLHGFFVPPASVTVLSAEEPVLGHAYFRVQVMGDTSHFRFSGEPVSYYGGFAAPFQQ